ncbi:Oxidoreductase molybdopterin binding domain-containing protein [Variovorax sp. YR750]|uniref:molybdopterin-dependent oxidoreductase n=1 Tax=Variovorax sp. YR750 TaxID=1884384 RepID=UPI0008D62A90|nr:molybdopterin-dependent oxidoreductase [Variovorax sp. YR750]SEK92525.1 Oxidoreductase molybdopterin binding domain-containing protein [Variovorax sp. YR750]
MDWSRGWVSGAVALLLAGCGGGGDNNGGVFFPIVPAPAPAPTPAPPPPPAPSPAPAPAPAVQLGGAVDRPGAFTEADLAARTPITQTVNFSSGSGPQTHTYTGAGLWPLLSDAGIQLDGAIKNDVLSRYLLATGADGYKVVFALGELSPDFGNKPSVVAYAENMSGTSAPLGTADGPFRVTAPGDVKGGRYVSNLVRLDVMAAPATAAGVGGGTSTSFAVSGKVGTSMSFDATALKGLTPAPDLTIGANVYHGVSLWTLLSGLGLPTTPKNATLGMFAVVTGSDGYRATLSLGEIDPNFGGKAAMVAYQMNGADLTTTGFARLVVPGEVKQGRSVSNLIAIEVFSTLGP